MQRNIRAGFLLVILIGLSLIVACNPQAQPQPGETDSLKRMISQLHGVYTWRGDLDRWDYSAKIELEGILSKIPPESAVGVLIECLDDPSASASVLDNKPVALGIVCYQGLSQLASYEPTDASGDIAASWPGFVSPKASPEDMRSAKAAGRKAQEAKLLISL